MNVGVLVAGPGTAASAIAADVRAEYLRATNETGRFSLAVPGGSVAERTFPAFAALDVDWSRADIVWADERAVEPTDAESNYAVAASLWLEPSRVPARSVHRMPAEQRDLAAAAAVYEHELAATLGPLGRLDYVLLGVGPDGHVASLFPGHPALAETTRSVVVINDAPKPPARRLTLTLPVIVAARRVVVAAFGDEKARVLGDVFAGRVPHLPVTQVLQQTLRPWLVVDEAAASRLPEGVLNDAARDGR